MNQRNRASCETVSSNNVRNYVHKVSPTWLSKHELNKKQIRQGSVSERKSMRTQPQTENKRQLRKPRAGDSLL